MDAYVDKGISFVERLVKEAYAAHPVEQARGGARFQNALQALNSQYGFQGSDMNQGALANTPGYYKGVRSAYDQHMASAPKPSAAETQPKVVSVAK